VEATSVFEFPRDLRTRVAAIVRRVRVITPKMLNSVPGCERKYSDSPAIEIGDRRSPAVPTKTNRIKIERISRKISISVGALDRWTAAAAPSTDTPLVHRAPLSDCV